MVELRVSPQCSGMGTPFSSRNPTGSGRMLYPKHSKFIYWAYTKLIKITKLRTVIIAFPAGSPENARGDYLNGFIYFLWGPKVLMVSENPISPKIQGPWIPRNSFVNLI